MMMTACRAAAAGIFPQQGSMMPTAELEMEVEFFRGQGVKLSSRASKNNLKSQQQ